MLIAGVGRDGLELKVPVVSHLPYKLGDATVDFDTLDPVKKNTAIVSLILELPPVVRLLPLFLTATC